MAVCDDCGDSAVGDRWYSWCNECGNDRVQDLITKDTVSKWQQVKWFWQGRCTDCGGELQDWSWKKATCLQCGRIFS